MTKNPGGGEGAGAAKQGGVLEMGVKPVLDIPESPGATEKFYRVPVCRAPLLPTSCRYTQPFPTTRAA